MDELLSAIIGLIGVIIGSIVTYVGQYFLFRFEYKKWKKEKKIEILRLRKEGLEKKYNESDEELKEMLLKSTVNIDMGTNFIISFPDNVKDAFNKALKNEEGKSESTRYADVLVEMKRSLSQIDKEIDKEIDEK